MVEVELKTRGATVARVHVPPFKPMPEVLMWGTRVFRRTRSEQGHTYSECFAYYITDDQTFTASAPAKCEPRGD